MLPLGSLIYKELFYATHRYHYYDSGSQSFCVISRSEKKSSSLQQDIQTLLGLGLLAPLNFALDHEYKNVRISGINLLDETLIINLSKEYLAYSAKAERRFMISLLFNVQQNFPSVREVQVFVNSQRLNFLHGDVFYGWPYQMHTTKNLAGFFLSSSMLKAGRLAAGAGPPTPNTLDQATGYFQSDNHTQTSADEYLARLRPGLHGYIFLEAENEPLRSGNFPLCKSY